MSQCHIYMVYVDYMFVKGYLLLDGISLWFRSPVVSLEVGGFFLINILLLCQAILKLVTK